MRYDTAMPATSTPSAAYDALNHRVRTDVGSTSREFIFNTNGQRVSTTSAFPPNRNQQNYFPPKMGITSLVKPPNHLTASFQTR
jgi:hypothetical protein